ncbi:ankyrin repeat domain-containing protein [Candidatus Dependentiae bacterium]|nr:ankyrin repeat domain-containing protein [Candidatus Dependentiae bacterium]
MNKTLFLSLIALCEFTFTSDLDKELIKALQSNNEHQVDELIAQKVDVNKIDPGTDWTPLHQALVYSNPTIIKKLINAKADVNKVADMGKVPLFRAVDTNNLNIIQMLIDAGAEVNATDKDKKTPLHSSLVTFSPNKSIIKLLLQANANPLIKDVHGQTALDFAKLYTTLPESWKTQVNEAKQQEIIKLIEEYIQLLNKTKATPDENTLGKAVAFGSPVLVRELLQKVKPSPYLLSQYGALAQEKYASTQEKPYQIIGKILGDYLNQVRLAHRLTGATAYATTSTELSKDIAKTIAGYVYSKN